MVIGSYGIPWVIIQSILPFEKLNRTVGPGINDFLLRPVDAAYRHIHPVAVIGCYTAWCERFLILAQLVQNFIARNMGSRLTISVKKSKPLHG
jgi:hypothetical protein